MTQGALNELANLTATMDVVTCKQQEKVWKMILGNTKINDCLVKRKKEGGTKGDAPTGSHPDAVQIGELLDGRVEARNLSTHSASSAEELGALVALAKARRTTAATERNAHALDLFARVQREVSRAAGRAQNNVRGTGRIATTASGIPRMIAGFDQFISQR